MPGPVAEITDPAELDEVRALPLRAWALNEGANRFVRIETTLVTGRRFGDGPNS